MDAVADFFDVSKQMAKIRMIDLGYTEAIGVLNYKGRGYIQSYVTKGPGKDLTYDVEPYGRMLSDFQNHPSKA